MVGFDTNIYIYVLERNPVFFEAASAALQSVGQADGLICLPSLTFTEILSGSADKQALAFFETATFLHYALTDEIAMLAGQLRFQNKALKTADAIHLATALVAGADRFITNDNQLPKLAIGIEIVPLNTFKT